MLFDSSFKNCRIKNLFAEDMRSCERGVNFVMVKINIVSPSAGMPLL